MNSTHCRSDFCPGGNCAGCKDGQIWCQDPRCDPYCPGCIVPDNYDRFVNTVLLIFLVCFIVLLVIVVAGWGRTSSLLYVPLSELPTTCTPAHETQWQPDEWQSPTVGAPSGCWSL